MILMNLSVDLRSSDVVKQKTWLKDLGSQDPPSALQKWKRTSPPWVMMYHKTPEELFMYTAVIHKV